MGLEKETDQGCVKLIDEDRGGGGYSKPRGGKEEIAQQLVQPHGQIRGNGDTYKDVDVH